MSIRPDEQYYTAAQVRELDRIAIEERGIAGLTLMQRAGAACFNALLWQWPAVRRVIIWCGTGNNGGDGFVIATLAQAAGLDVDCAVLGEEAAVKGTAREALRIAREAGVGVQFCRDIPTLAVQPDTVVIDALLGTGLGGEVRQPFRAAIEKINGSTLPVLAVDIPSGLCSDTGSVLGVAVKADLTVTFIGRKLGQVKGEGPRLCGRLVFDDLGASVAGSA